MVEAEEQPDQEMLDAWTPPAVGTAAGVAIAVGVMCTIAGAIAGIVMMAHRRRVECPNGTYFAEGTTDFRCFSHAHLAEGFTVVVLSVALGIIVFLVGMILQRS